MTSKRLAGSWQSKKVPLRYRLFSLSAGGREVPEMPADLHGRLGTTDPRSESTCGTHFRGQRFPVRVEDLVELNPYAVDVRYADDWREPQLSDARRALALAARVRDAVRERMPPQVLD